MGGYCVKTNTKNSMEENKQIKGQPKSFFKRLKENVDDHEEQMAVLGAAVRLGVVIWSGFIITLSYVELPMIKKSATAGDITFVASTLRVRWQLSGCLRETETERKTETEKLKQNQKHEKINSAFSSAITRHS